MEQVVQSEQIPARRRSRRAGTGKAFLVFKIVMFVIFLIYAISLLYPILFGFLSSLKTQSEYSNAPTALPVEWLLISVGSVRFSDRPGGKERFRMSNFLCSGNSISGS